MNEGVREDPFRELLYLAVYEELGTVADVGTLRALHGLLLERGAEPGVEVHFGLIYHRSGRLFLLPPFLSVSPRTKHWTGLVRLTKLMAWLQSPEGLSGVLGCNLGVVRLGWGASLAKPFGGGSQRAKLGLYWCTVGKCTYYIRYLGLPSRDRPKDAPMCHGVDRQPLQ